MASLLLNTLQTHYPNQPLETLEQVEQEINNAMPTATDDEKIQEIAKNKKAQQDGTWATSLVQDEALDRAQAARNERLQSAQNGGIQDYSQNKTVSLVPPGQSERTGLGKGATQNYITPEQIQEAKRQGLVKADLDASGTGFAEALSAFGAGLRKGDVGAAFRTAQEASHDKTRNALAQFDKGVEDKLRMKEVARADKRDSREDTKAAREERAYQTAQQILKDKKDPASEISKNAQQILLELKPDFDPNALSRLSAEAIEARIPTLKFKIENTYKTDKEARDRAEQAIDNERAERGIAAQNKLAAASLGLRQSSDTRDATFRADNEAHNRQQEEQNRKDKETKERTPSDKQNEELTNIVDALRANDAILASTEGETAGAGTGPVVGRLVPDALTSDAGQQARTNIRDNRITLRKAISGSGFSASEAAEYERLLPAESDTVSQMKSKSEARKKLLERKAKSQLEVMAPTKDVSKYESIPELRAQLPGKKPAVAEGTTKTLPDGRTVKRINNQWVVQ